MLKTFTAVTLATSLLAGPAFAQGKAVEAPVAPVLEAGQLPSNGLAAAGAAAGVVVLGIAAVAIFADSDDNTTTTTTTQ